MRWAKSYSIIDHRFLHDGFFEKLSHQELILYFFLVMVGDINGRSYYGESTISKILRLNIQSLREARKHLLAEKLINYEEPYWWVRDFGNRQKQVYHFKTKISETENEVPRELAKKEIQKIINKLSNRNM